VQSAAISIALLLTASVIASAQPCPPLQIGNRDGNYIIPGSLGGIRYDGDLALDAYIQQNASGRPSVVVVHGGGWTSGSRIAHVGQILELLTRSGYNWFSVDYRTAGLERFEDSLTDLRRALAFIRCNAAELGIEPDRLVLLGEDSGGDLAALIAAERPHGVIGAVLIGGAYDVPASASVNRTSGSTSTAASPLARIAERMPPVLLIHGASDSEVPIDQPRHYCAEVTRQSGRCQLIEVAGASHRSENWWPSQWGYKRGLVEWLSMLAPGESRSHRPRAGAVQKDIVYDRSTGLTLDAFVPRGGKAGPAVIVVHGGGWEAGDKVTYVTPLFEPLARAGFAWFSIDYRLTPKARNEDQLEDVRQAIRFVRAEHVRFNVDPTRVVLIGESASGQLVTQLATEDPSLAGVVSFYGVYDLPSMVTDASPRSLLVRLFQRNILDDDARAVLRRYSPQYQAHRRMPPILLVNGTAERLWDQARTFAQRLAELGVPHDLVALEGAPHGMENWEGHPEWSFYKQRVVDWIRTLGRVEARP
jgi:alpha-L-fucosidase 2